VIDFIDESVHLGYEFIAVSVWM